jgi:glycosyltransferase involved in cell wall biosynthesis
MKVSIITVVYNNVTTIRKAIDSVLSQDYNQIEYIIIDGGSTDGTLNIIKEFGNRIKYVTERDQGLYDAMNKGIRLSSGDIVGILNSDDTFFDTGVVSSVISGFENNDVEAIVADILFVTKLDNFKIIRRYSSKTWSPEQFAWGLMPPHPSFFVRKSLFDSFGLYKTDYKIGADYELLIRFLFVNRIRWVYLPLVTTKMLLGGASTNGIKSTITLNKEILRACRENGVKTNYFMIYSKYFFKPFEFIFNN